MLLLSLTYLDLRRIAVSLLTVILSGQLIGLVQQIKFPRRGSGRKRITKEAKGLCGKSAGSFFMPAAASESLSNFPYISYKIVAQGKIRVK